MATAVVPITTATARQRRNVKASTSNTQPKAITLRSARSSSSSFSSSLSSLLMRSRTAGGMLGSSCVIAARSAAAVLMASAPGCREISTATAGSPSMRKKRPRASSSARTVASSPKRNTRVPGPRTGNACKSSSAFGWSRNTTFCVVACAGSPPRSSAPNACTMRAPAIASDSRCGEMPMRRSCTGSYDTDTPRSVPPRTCTPATPGMLPSRGLTRSSSSFCNVPEVYGPNTDSDISGASSSPSGT